MQGLAETGYIVGQNVAIEYRWVETLDQMPALAAELVRRQPSVIFAKSDRGSTRSESCNFNDPICSHYGR